MLPALSDFAPPHRSAPASTHLYQPGRPALWDAQIGAGVCAQLRITPNHLNALCRRLLHHTASEVLHARVVAEARQLLIQSRASVADVAAILGFADASYFARYFKKYVRQTPLAFRQAASSGPA